MEYVLWKFHSTVSRLRMERRLKKSTFKWITTESSKYEELPDIPVDHEKLYACTALLIPAQRMVTRPVTCLEQMTNDPCWCLCIPTCSHLYKYLYLYFCLYFLRHGLCLIIQASLELMLPRLCLLCAVFIDVPLHDVSNFIFWKEYTCLREKEKI